MKYLFNVTNVVTIILNFKYQKNMLINIIPEHCDKILIFHILQICLI